VGEMTHCLVFWGGLEAGFFFPRGAREVVGEQRGQHASAVRSTWLSLKEYPTRAKLISSKNKKITLLFFSHRRTTADAPLASTRTQNKYFLFLFVSQPSPRTLHFNISPIQGMRITSS